MDAWIDIPLTVDEGLDGYRLDRFLKERIGRLSRTRIQRIIERGQVRREDDVVLARASIRVRAGERLVLRRPAPEEPDVVLDYAVLHEDPGLLVLDKPAGLPVHPSARYHAHTLTALIRTRMGADHGWEMAHRLDRETSGVLVFGRRRRGPDGIRAPELATGGILKKAFQERRVSKQYLAIVRGTVRHAGVLDMPLALDPHSRIRIKMGCVPSSQGGLPARTEIEPLRWGSFRGESVSLVRCRPRTGRQHQIRVHLALAGTPVLGDKLYGLDEQAFLDVIEGGRPITELEAELGLSRHALHASRLDLPHPLDEQPRTFRAPWPAELDAIIRSATEDVA